MWTGKWLAAAPNIFVDQIQIHLLCTLTSSSFSIQKTESTPMLLLEAFQIADLFLGGNKEVLKRQHAHTYLMAASRAEWSGMTMSTTEGSNWYLNSNAGVLQ